MLFVFLFFKKVNAPTSGSELMTMTGLNFAQVRKKNHPIRAKNPKLRSCFHALRGPLLRNDLAVWRRFVFLNFYFRPHFGHRCGWAIGAKTPFNSPIAKPHCPSHTYWPTSLPFPSLLANLIVVSEIAAVLLLRLLQIALSPTVALGYIVMAYIVFCSSIYRRPSR